MLPRIALLFGCPFVISLHHFLRLKCEERHNLHIFSSWFTLFLPLRMEFHSNQSDSRTSLASSLSPLGIPGCPVVLIQEVSLWSFNLVVLGGSLLDEQKRSNREGCLEIVTEVHHHLWYLSAFNIVAFFWLDMGIVYVQRQNVTPKTNNLVKMRRLTPFPTGFSRRFLLNLI